MKRVSKAVGSSVQNVNAAEIAVSGRDNFVTALQGRVAGMSVGSTSGVSGCIIERYFKNCHIHFGQ